MKWVMDHLPKNQDWSALYKPLELFTARWVVEYAVSIKRNRQGPSTEEARVRRSGEQDLQNTLPAQMEDQIHSCNIFSRSVQNH